MAKIVTLEDLEREYGPDAAAEIWRDLKEESWIAQCETAKHFQPAQDQAGGVIRL